MPSAMDTSADDYRRLLDAAERLFYARGIQAVGMDEIRAMSNVSLKRIYRLFRGKGDLVIAMLNRRDIRWRHGLAEYVEQRPIPERAVAVFDWLFDWFQSPGFRGCAWINAYGELGGLDQEVVTAVRAHKKAFRDYIAQVVAESGHPASLSSALFLLAEGAIVAAGIDGDPTAAHRAKEAAQMLVSAVIR